MNKGYSIDLKYFCLSLKTQFINLNDHNIKSTRVNTVNI